jgi:hypothetical protein
LDEIKQEVDKLLSASHKSGREAVDGIFDGFIQLSRLVHKAAQEKAERRRLRRNEKARRLYAVRKELGIPTRKLKAKPEPEYDYDYEAPTSCYCSTCRMPPCGWCDGSIQRDEEEE